MFIVDNRPKVNYRWRFGQKYSRSLGSTSTKSGKGEMAACSFSAEAERLAFIRPHIIESRMDVSVRKGTIPT